MRKRHLLYIALGLLLAGCSSADDAGGALGSDGAHELTGIKASIVGADAQAATRYGTVTTLVHYVGREVFVSEDMIMFTKICRTSHPLANFTYPKEGDSYEGIRFDASGASVSWSRNTEDEGPDRVYWTDAVSPHTFVAYCTPQGTFDWKKETDGYYRGSIGVPEESTLIEYTDNDKLKAEDLLIAYDTEMQSEPGGSVALVKFHHALSSIRVIVNINGFSSGKEATSDNATRVSNMQLLNQPTKYVWDKTGFGAKAETSGQVNRNMKLWMPNPEGTNVDQSRIFTFYGITTPHTESNLQLTFTVTYPDPIQPSVTLTKTYTATLSEVSFKAGFNTTVNITLNHENESMSVGAEYEEWQFASIPHEGRIKKNSTFLESTERTNVTIVGDTKATADDATWLYELNGTVYDIYGNDGSSVEKAYKIATADQLLSFAYEVKADRDFSDFSGKFIRLDADITLQKTPDKTKSEMNSEDEGYGDAPEAIEWIGIGDDKHAFNGTFLGGKRFIYRLKGKPLFAKLGTQAHIQQLQVNSVHRSDGSTPAVTGTGLFADTNAGMLSGCTVVGDVALDGSTAGALVGTNTGSVWCCYHVGATIGTTSGAVGGLVGSNSGKIACCYHSGKVTGTNTGGITASNTGTLDHNYYNSSLLPTVTFSDAQVIGKSSAEMTKQDFVTEINTAIGTWRGSNTGYDPYHYVYQPANYPNLESGGQ